MLCVKAAAQVLYVNDAIRMRCAICCARFESRSDLSYLTVFCLPIDDATGRLVVYVGVA